MILGVRDNGRGSLSERFLMMMGTRRSSESHPPGCWKGGKGKGGGRRLVGWFEVVGGRKRGGWRVKRSSLLQIAGEARVAVEGREARSKWGVMRVRVGVERRMEMRRELND